MTKKTTLLFTLLLVALTAQAAPRTQAQMEQLALQAMNQQRTARHLAPRNVALKVLEKTATYQIMGYEQGDGFAVVSADDLAPEVLGVSMKPYSEGRNANFQWWLRAMNDVIANAVARQTPLHAIAPNTNLYPAEVEPMVTTEWDQDTPYDGMCPIYSGSTHCLTGCVATALAQILNYHRTPVHGYGQHTVYYGGQAVTANFEEDYYDWDNMLDRYVAGNYNDTQAQAVALLMRDCGVAANMDYGGADWWQGGHAFVLHGYRQDGKVYVNWGWSSDDDGYYDISMLNPSGYQFNYGQDMIIGVKSDGVVGMRSANIELAEAGLLQQQVESLEGEGAIGSLTITGPLSQADLDYVRFLAGFDSEGNATEGQLRTLDLTNATLNGNELPEGLFRDCQKLQRVRFPQALEKIGREAFSGCTGLRELRLPCREVPALGGSGVFAGVPVSMVRLYVRSGLKTKYSQKAQWRDFNKDNIIEFGTSVKVRNVIRKYGEENPTFTYTVTGDAISGKPELTCEATPLSPAGRYPVLISRGTVTNSDVDFIDGYMIVQKVDATATVANCTREQGEPNPQFVLTYEGLVNDELLPVWTEAPVFYCEADEYSPAGDYPITVTATAESYNMTFVAGTLTVTPPTTTSVSAVHDNQPGSESIQDLQGRTMGVARVGLRPGIYIMNGKKILVK
ncbi:MAG: C10 family peptidase [Prevotella sp.]|nr:C10 family peptidase [Prevotella sp.]